MKKIVLICFVLMSALISEVWAQRTVSGKVISDASGEGLPGVTVMALGTGVGVVTNIEGAYRIQVPEGANTLEFSFVGFTTQDVQIGNRSVIDVRLQEDVAQLDEVMVVGYGTQSKLDVTGSIAQIDGQEIENVPVPSLESAIQGRAAGVFVEQGSGKPGQGIRVRVRGGSSLTASNQPLYVVDGVPIVTESLGTSTNEPTNPLADLNFNDVESVEVLKDASASAIYGSRASNGVVMITTKRGKAGKTRFNATFARGISTPTNKRDWMNGEEYMEYMNEAYDNLEEAEGIDIASNYFGVSEKADVWDLYIPGWRDTLNTDWQDLAFRTGGTTQFDLSASGGNEKTRFYVSGSYFGQEGILIGNDFGRISSRFNLDHQVNDRLNFLANFSLSRTQNDRVANDNAFATPLQMIALPPVQPAIDPATNELNRNTVYYNGLIEQQDAFFQTVVFRNLSNLKASYELVPGLKFNSAFGLDLTNQDEDGYQGRNTQDGAPTGRGTSRRVGYLNYSLDNYFSYNKTLGEVHNMDFILGMNYQKTEQESTSLQADGYPSDEFTRLGDAAEIVSGGSFGTEFSILSYFFRANYNYSNKYLLSLNGRIDGSSRFGANNRYGFFPAASVGYVLSEESFMNTSSTISFLKLRGSIGYTGNAEIGNFDWRGLSGGATYGGNSGLQLATLANPDLKWETTRQIDVGLDFGLFQNRLSGTVDYYVKHTSDLLLNVTLPATTGFTSVLQNVGELQNRGAEFAINSENLVGDFKWSTNFNISLNRNKILDLGKVATGEDRVITSGINRVMVGEPIGVFWMREYAGVDPDNGDALWYINDSDADPEDARETTNSYDEANLTIVGDPNPDFIGGLTNNFSYKGVDLSFLLQFVSGNDVYNDGGVYQMDDGAWFDNKDSSLLTRWQKPGDITNVPKPYFLNGNGARESSRYLYDASYLRLRNITLGYTLPSELMSKAKIERLRFYVTGQNLLTFTDYPGWDPEVNYAGTNPSNQTNNIRAGRDFYTAPQARTVVVGVNLTF